MPSLLLLIDNPAFGSLLQESLEAKELSCTLSESAISDDVQQSVIEHRFDLCIIYSSGGDAASVNCLRVLRELSDMPAYVLLESDKNALLSAFESGADDALLLPISAQVIACKIKAYCKRLFEKDQKVLSYTIGNYLFDVSQQRLVFCDGEVSTLTGKENALLEMLVSKQGQTVAKSLILLRIWHENSYFNARSLSVYINRLRHKLSLDPNIVIQGVREGGYKIYVR